MTCERHYEGAFTADLFIEVLKSKRSPKLRCSKYAIFSHQNHGTKEENFSLPKNPLLKPVQPDVPEGPVKTTFAVSLLTEQQLFPTVNDALGTGLHILCSYTVADQPVQLTELYKMLLCRCSALTTVFIASCNGSNTSHLPEKRGCLTATKLKSTWIADQ